MRHLASRGDNRTEGRTDSRTDDRHEEQPRSGVEWLVDGLRAGLVDGLGLSMPLSAFAVATKSPLTGMCIVIRTGTTIRGNKVKRVKGDNNEDN